jgi:hypothetical protein
VEAEVGPSRPSIEKGRGGEGRGEEEEEGNGKETF